MDKKKKSVINSYHNARRHLFWTYEKYNDLDPALEVLEKRYSYFKANWKAGLKAELLFYHEYKYRYGLETLLDAGVKADFTGLKNQSPTNFDVTTNTNYKNINDYVEVIQKRGKKYEIVLVDLKKQNIEFFSLRFPICKNCGMFSHYVLYLLPPSTDFYNATSISDLQRLLSYCPYCDDDEELEILSFEIPSLIQLSSELEEEQRDPITRIDGFNSNTYVKQESINILRFFEKETRKLISGLAESEYVFTGRDGDGYWHGHLHWRHPLAKDLGESIPFAYL